MQVSIDIPDQGHTLANMLKGKLFDNGASFAACIVPHPEDTFLRVTVTADDPKECILAALRDCASVVDQAKTDIKAYKAHCDIIMED